MMKNIIANVMMWGARVGVVKQGVSAIEFQYDKKWIASKIQTSPVMMPLSSDVYQFPELNKINAFQGLPGLLADALPDQFGNKIIAAHLAKRGLTFSDLTAVEKLLYMGDRSMGALEFEPILENQKNELIDNVLSIKDLMEQSRVLIQGDVTSVLNNALSEILRVGGSAGGARPKAVVLWDRKSNEMRSGFANQKADEEAWLVKFDGTGTIERPDMAAKPYNRIEFTYSEIARLAGIEMAETRLFLDGEYAHFMTKRFDRSFKNKNHVHSLGGLLHIDFNQPGLVSYEKFLMTCRQLNLGQVEVEQAYKRMLLNLLGVNQDDHVKNISFLLKQGGQWELAPAYDISFVKGAGWTKNHQMSFGGNVDGDTVSVDDVIRIGSMFDIKNPWHAVQEVSDALAQWRSLAEENGVPKEYVSAIEGCHRAYKRPALTNKRK